MPKSAPAFDVPLPLADNLCFAVYSTALAFNAVYKPILDRLHLTYPQYLVMLVLWQQDDVPVKDIGRLLHLDSGTLTPLLKRLEAIGYLARRRHAADERQLRITLTDAGRALADQARSIPQGIGAACGLGWDELGKLRDQLTQLREQLDRAAEASRPASAAVR